MSDVVWYVLGLAPLVVAVAWAAVLFSRRDRGSEPAPLESGNAREAIRAVIERREPR